MGYKIKAGRSSLLAMKADEDVLRSLGRGAYGHLIYIQPSVLCLDDNLYLYC